MAPFLIGSKNSSSRPSFGEWVLHSVAPASPLQCGGKFCIFSLNRQLRFLAQLFGVNFMPNFSVLDSALNRTHKPPTKCPSAAPAHLDTGTGWLFKQKNTRARQASRDDIPNSFIPTHHPINIRPTILPLPWNRLGWESEAKTMNNEHHSVYIICQQ